MNPTPNTLSDPKPRGSSGFKVVMTIPGADTLADAPADAPPVALWMPMGREQLPHTTGRERL